MGLVAAGGMFTEQGAAGRQGAVKQARGGQHQNPEAVGSEQDPPLLEPVGDKGFWVAWGMGREGSGRSSPYIWGRRG